MMKYWDLLAGLYDRVTMGRNGAGNRLLSERVASLVRPDDEVLECACGTGLLTASLVKVARSVTATDYSEGMLREVGRKCGRATNLRLETADILHLPYADESYDLVVAGNVLHLLEDPLAALLELRRVCRVGGRLILPTYLEDPRDAQWRRVLSLVGVSLRHSFSLEEYGALLRSVEGLELTRLEQLPGRPPCGLALLRRVR